jgi:hypothetical protein
LILRIKFQKLVSLKKRTESLPHQKTSTTEAASHQNYYLVVKYRKLEGHVCATLCDHGPLKQVFRNGNCCIAHSIMICIQVQVDRVRPMVTGHLPAYSLNARFLIQMVIVGHLVVLYIRKGILLLKKKTESNTNEEQKTSDSSVHIMTLSY